MTTTTKSPELVRTLVEDRWDQATVVPIVGPDRGSEITTSEAYDRLDAALAELGARVAGGEVAAFGLSAVLDELHETIRVRLCEWAIDYLVTDGRAYTAEQAAAA